VAAAHATIAETASGSLSIALVTGGRATLVIRRNSLSYRDARAGLGARAHVTVSQARGVLRLAGRTSRRAALTIVIRTRSHAIAISIGAYHRRGSISGRLSVRSTG
jgi:hypothetical protein